VNARRRPRALVSGGIGGIGRATVAALVADGCRVVVTDVVSRNPPPEAEAIIVRDLAEPAECVRAVEEAADVLSGLDVLVHSAGITRDGVAWKLSPEDWDAVVGVNLDAAFHLSRTAVPILRRSDGGSIVYVSSINGERGKFGQTAYAASKAGLHGLARSLAREVGAFGIRVNVVAPGMIRTPMTAQLPDHVQEAARAESCLDRIGEPGDVASVIAFLVSSAARHVTGQVLRVDGGQYL
jgi:3-oxoacyl-[acyl-carrier protein] reductase